jgi:hypothetical protein
VPWKSIESGAVYHPFAFAGRAGLAVTLGGVASNLKPKVDGALVFPATSRHVPDTDAVALSGDE